MLAPGDEGPTDPAVSASTGSANFRIPIEVPPGPGGLAPSLALGYSSRSGDGPYGVGWSLPLGEIHCSTRFGVPDYGYANCERFELNGQLLTEGAADVYHSLVETFQKIEYKSGSNSWVVTNPNGTIQRYGVNADSRVESGLGTARWLLAEIEIPTPGSTRNRVFFSYQDTFDNETDLGTRYPSLITYGAGATKASGKRSVEFFFDEIRPDPIRDFAGGIERKITRRITEIKVSSYGNPVRRYAFGFDGLDDVGASFAYTTGRSRLTWVQQFGDDCTGPIGLCTGGLPRQEYVYTDSHDDDPDDPAVPSQFSKFQKGEEYTPTDPKPDNWAVDLGGVVVERFLEDKKAVRIADVNGDGLPDLIEIGARNGYLADKSPTTDGDGEFVPGVFTSFSPLDYVKIRLNTGSGFSEDQEWTTALLNLQVARPRADFVQIAPVESSLARDVLHVAARGGIIDASPSTVQYDTIDYPISAMWQATTSRPEARYSVGGDGSLVSGDPTPGWIEGLGRLFFTDVNADGLADIVVSVRLSGVDKNVTPNGTAIDPGLVQREPGLVVRRVYRNTGDPSTGGWERDEGLEAGLPPFGLVQFESELGAEQRIPFGVGPDPTDILSTWFPGTADADEKSGIDWLDIDSNGEYDSNPCTARGLYGSMQFAPGNEYYPPTIPDFCSNLVNLDPRFQDLNGDGFVDLMVLEMDDVEALHQGPYGWYHRGYLAPTLPANTARSVAWIQVPDAAPGEDRWVPAPQYDLPNVQFMTQGNGGNKPDTPTPGSTWMLPFSHSQPNLLHPRDGLAGCPGDDLLGGGFNFPDFSICAPLSSNVPTGVQFVDVNRDGLTDVVWSLYDYQDIGQTTPPYPGSPLISEGVLLNTGTGWCSSKPELVTQNIVSQCSHASIYYPPPNDGTGDIASEAGLGFRDSIKAGYPSGQLIDLNADGFLDYVQMHVTQDRPGNKAWLYNPAGATENPQNMWIRDDRYDLNIDFHWLALPDGTNLLGLTALDVNGDGATDVIGDDLYFEDAFIFTGGDDKEHPQTFVSDASKSHHSDLIRLVRNGRGGEVSIEYRSAIVQRDSATINPPGSADLEAKATDHAGDTGESLIGASIEDVIRWTTSPVVSEVRIKGPNRAPDPANAGPGFGPPTKYRYAHPRFCVGSQSDLGYRVVERARPGGEVVTSSYYQTHGRAGKASEVLVSEGGIDVHEYREHWETQEFPAFLGGPLVPATLGGSYNHSDVHVGRLAHVSSKNLYSGGSGAHFERSFEYADGYGYNFVEKISETRPTSELATWRTPGSDSGNDIFGLVLIEEKFDYLTSEKGNADFLDHTTIAYEHGRPSSVTKVVQNRDGTGTSTDESQTMTYDGYGNLASQTVGPTGNTQTTSFYYDGDVNPGATTWPDGTQDSRSVRVGVMDPSGGIVSSIPDPGTGAIVETASTYTDEPSSKITLDAFGRPIESFVHDGTAWLKTSKAVYDDPEFAPPVVTRLDYVDSSANDLEAIWSSVVSDGFGGTWKEIGETTVAFVGTFTYHDPATRTVQKSLPAVCYDAACPGYDGSTEPSASRTQVDAIGRPIRAETPYGFSAFDYSSVSSTAMTGPWTASPNAFDVVLEKNGKGDLIRRGMDGDRIAWVEECDNAVPAGTADLSGTACTGGSFGLATTFYSYEGSGELRAILDPRSGGSFSDSNHYLQYHYDTLGRVVQIDDPALAGTGNSQTTYDAFGNILAVTNARGQTRTHSYDGLNRLTGIVTPSTETDYSVTYSAGQRQASGDSSDDYIRSLTLDSLGRVEKEHMRVANDTGSLRSFHTDVAYDLVGRVTEVLYPAQHYTVFNGWVDSTVRYEYDRGFLQQICDLGPTTDCASAPTKYVSNASFNALGQPSTMTFPIGSRTFTYDATTQRLQQDNFASSTYSYNRNYGTPDEIGNVLAISGNESATPALDMDETYTYDQRNRISTWTKEGTSYTYDYDDLGNLTTHANEAQEYTDATRPHAITRREITATAPTVYSYDDDGNVGSIVGESDSQYFEFDSANQAVCLSKNSTSCDTRVAYDVAGKRIAEYPGGQDYRVYIGESFLFEGFATESKASIEVMLDGKRIALKRFAPNLRVATAGDWVLFIPSPPWLIGGAGCAGLFLVFLGLRNGSLILVERRPLRAATAFGAAFSLLIPSIALAGGGGGASDPPTYFWEISDPLGTGMVMMDGNGDRVRHQVFTPFGGIHAETGANFRTFYAGHRRDEDSGMFYMQARWYDPGSGRFLSVDPVVRSIGIPKSANAYSYIENNPVNGVDPTGEFALIAAAVVVTWFIIPVGAAGIFGGAPAARSATKGAMLGAGIAGSALLVPAVLSPVGASGVAVQAGISPTAVAAAPAVVGKALDMLADTGGASTGASTGSDRADAWLDLLGAAKDVADSISDSRDGSTPDTGGASQGTRSSAGSGSNRSTASPSGSGGTPSSAASASGFAGASFAFGAGGSSAFSVIGGVGVTTFSNGVVGYTSIVDCPCAPF